MVTIVGGITVNLGIHTVNPIAVVSEGCTTVAMTKYCTKLKFQMLQISYNIDIVILVALI